MPVRSREIGVVTWKSPRKLTAAYMVGNRSRSDPGVGFLETVSTTSESLGTNQLRPSRLLSAKNWAAHLVPETDHVLVDYLARNYWNLPIYVVANKKRIC